MARFPRTTLCLALTLACTVGSAVARADDLPVRTWTAEQIEPDGAPEHWRSVDVTSSGIGQSVIVYPGRDDPSASATAVHAAVQDFGGRIEGPQKLGDGYYARADGSLLGGVVAAWWDGGDVQIAELPPGEREFKPSFGVTGAASGYSYEEPKVAVGDDGTAVVVYLAPDLLGGRQHLAAVVRPAGGEFGQPEQISASFDSTDVNATDVAVGPDGTIVAGFVANAQPYAVVRSTAGVWSPPKPLGTAYAQSWFMPQVGVDALGDVVAAWGEPDPGSDAGPVKIAFRRKGASDFDTPKDTGLLMTDYGRIALAVSAVGEAVLVVEAQSNNPYGGTHLEGIHALYGNATTGLIGPPAALTDTWGHYPQVGWNTRGDVVVTYDECCPMALRERRRLPLSPFLPAADIQPPITFEGQRGGRWMLDADVDEFGNARATYVDGDPDPPPIFLATDGPGIFDEPAKVPDLGDFIADVVPPQPPPPPAPPVDVPPPPAIIPPPALTPPTRVVLKLALGVGVERRLSGRAHPRVMVRISCSKPCYARLAGKIGRLDLAPTDVVLTAAGTKRVGLTFKRRARSASAAGSADAVRLAVVAADRDGQIVRLKRTARVRPAR